MFQNKAVFVNECKLKRNNFSTSTIKLTKDLTAIYPR